MAEYCGVDISATISSQNFKQDEKKRSDRKKYAQDLREQLFNLSNVSYEKIEEYVLEQDQIYTETKEKLEEAEKTAVLNNSVWARYKSAQKKAGVISCVAIVIGVVGILFANLIVFAVGVVGLLASYLYASKVLHLNDLAAEAQKCAPKELLELQEQVSAQQVRKKAAHTLADTKKKYEELSKDLGEENEFINGRLEKCEKD